MPDREPLFRRAHDDDPRERQAAALALGALADADLAPALVDLLIAEPDDVVLETWTWAVVGLGPASIPHLVAALEAPQNEPVRLLHALSKLEDATAQDAIIPFADDPRPAVAGKAWWALARIGDPTSWPVLAAHIGVTDPPLRHALTRAFVHRGPMALTVVVPRFADPDAAVRDHALDIAVRTLDPDAGGTAGRLRRTPADTEQRRRMELAIVETDAPEALAVLTQAAHEFQHPPLAELAQRLLAERSERSGGRA